MEETEVFNSLTNASWNHVSMESMSSIIYIESKIFAAKTTPPHFFCLKRYPPFNTEKLLEILEKNPQVYPQIAFSLSLLGDFEISSIPPSLKTRRMKSLLPWRISQVYPLAVPRFRWVW